jgi:membrane protease YdiL (CAAX protease family)
VILLFFPVLSLATGARLSLNGDWLWTLAGIVVFNGFAEETLFRGYVFGNLRRGNSFLGAGLISLLFFAAAHLFLFIGNPFAIALAGTLVAVTAAFPMAYLFERGGNTIWAPVILHVAVHTIRLVSIPETLYMPAVLAWLVLQIFLPLLVFAFRKYLKDEEI